ncbi:hypothetical protein BB561_002080 [Smittium simulii]|uniref:BZIP domain-containing protein n=1 Tax=Smittium simulii TaxID=133385 RepID=A0A2T9YRX1_9FUNG|nr:hypothetical protein BB561_002080 [Smittium simulii]
MADQKFNADMTLTSEILSSHFDDLSKNNSLFSQNLNPDLYSSSGYITQIQSFVNKHILDNFSGNDLMDTSNALISDNDKNPFITTYQNNIQNSNLSDFTFEKQSLSKLSQNFAEAHPNSPLWSTESTASEESSQFQHKNTDLPFSISSETSPKDHDYLSFQNSNCWNDAANSMGLNVDVGDSLSSKSNSLFDMGLIDKINPMSLNYSHSNIMDTIDSQMTLDTLINEYINVEAMGPLNNSNLGLATSNLINKNTLESKPLEGSNLATNTLLDKKNTLTNSFSLYKNTINVPFVDVKPKINDFSTQGSNIIKSQITENSQYSIKSISSSESIPKKTHRPVASKPQTLEIEIKPSLNNNLAQKSRFKQARKMTTNNSVAVSCDKIAKKIKTENDPNNSIFTNKSDTLPYLAQHQLPLGTHPRFTNILPKAGFLLPNTAQSPAANFNNINCFTSQNMDMNSTESIKKQDSITNIDNKPFIHPVSIQSSVGIPPVQISKPNVLSKQQVAPDQVAAKRQERLIKNRAAALQSRKKRREHMDYLEKKVADLESENFELKSKISNTDSLLQNVQGQLSELILKNKNLKESKNNSDIKESIEDTTIPPTDLNTYLAKKKPSNLKMISTQPSFFDSPNSKQNLVNSVLMAVLFSFTLLCIPNAIEPHLQHFGTGSHESSFQSYNDLPLQPHIPISKLEPEINQMILKDDESFLKNFDPNSQKAVTIYKSIVSLTTKLASSIYLPILLSKNLSEKTQNKLLKSPQPSLLSDDENVLSLIPLSHYSGGSAQTKLQQTSISDELNCSTLNLVSQIHTTFDATDDNIYEDSDEFIDIKMSDDLKQAPTKTLENSATLIQNDKYNNISSDVSQNTCDLTE